MHPLRRTTSCQTTSKITPSNPNFLARSTSLVPYPDTKPLVPKPGPVITTTCYNIRPSFSSLLRTLLGLFSVFPTFRAHPTGRKVTGTLFGHRRGYVTFVVQPDPRSEPVLLIELALPTSTLVKEMSSGLVRIALECDKAHARGSGPLFVEPTWTMYCNGKKCGPAVSRTCGGLDRHVLGMVGSVSVGAGVIPLVDGTKNESSAEGELLYMRARFERVVGGRDSEAFYMMNPDGNGGPELSIFLLRI